MFSSLSFFLFGMKENKKRMKTSLVFGKSGGFVHIANC